MPLFATTEEFKQYYPARVTFDLGDLLPTMEMVEREYLAEQVLGEAQYEALVTGPPDAALLAKCRPVVAHLAIYHYTGIGNVEFTTGGLSVASTDKKAPASEWRTRDLERAVLRQGYRALDVLIAFLHAKGAAYPLWGTSPQAAAMRGGMLRTTQEFNALVNIANSGYLFRSLLPSVRRIEDTAVRDTFCSEALVAELQAAAHGRAPSASQARLIRLAQRATAHLAMSEAIVELSLGMDMQGVWTFGSLANATVKDRPQPALDGRMQQRIDHHARVGSAALAALRTELQAQADAGTCPHYVASPCYVRQQNMNDTDTDSLVGGFL